MCNVAERDLELFILDLVSISPGLYSDMSK